LCSRVWARSNVSFLTFGAKVACVEAIAAEVPRVPERAVEALEPVALVERLRLGHVRERLEVHAREARTASTLDALREDLLADAEAADLGEKVHLAELAGALVAAHERREPAAADDRCAALLRGLDDPVGRASALIGAEHVIDLGVEDREAWSLRAEL